MKINMVLIWSVTFFAFSGSSAFSSEELSSSRGRFVTSSQSGFVARSPSRVRVIRPPAESPQITPPRRADSESTSSPSEPPRVCTVETVATRRGRSAGGPGGTHLQSRLAALGEHLRTRWDLEPSVDPLLELFLIQVPGKIPELWGMYGYCLNSGSKTVRRLVVKPVQSCFNPADPRESIRFIPGSLREVDEGCTPSPLCFTFNDSQIQIEALRSTAGRLTEENVEAIFSACPKFFIFLKNFGFYRKNLNGILENNNVLFLLNCFSSIKTAIAINIASYVSKFIHILNYTGKQKMCQDPQRLSGLDFNIPLKYAIVRP
jgi:hypothetical protein